MYNLLIVLRPREAGSFRQVVAYTATTAGRFHCTVVLSCISLSPDLAPGDSVGYNWMAPMQQSLDSLSFTIGAGSTVPEPQQSSLLFSLTKARQTTFKTLKPQGETLGKEALQLATSMGTQQPSDSSVGQQHEIMRLKRRFHADRQATRSFFGRLQTRKKFAQEVRQLSGVCLLAEPG